MFVNLPYGEDDIGDDILMICDWYEKEKMIIPWYVLLQPLV